MQLGIDVKHLEKSVDNFKLGPIDMTIEQGMVTTLVGNNGSGKSTFLKILMNLVKPDLGWVNLFGNDVGDSNEGWKKDIAYQPQTPVGYDNFTGLELKELISHWYLDWDEALFTSMVEKFDVPLTKRFGKLSEGAQQKLTLALTIPRNARLLILDEPTAYLDIPSKKILMDLLVDWMEEADRSIILASHQSDDILKLADYIAVLNQGELAGYFEKEELIESYKRFWFKDDLGELTMLPGEVLRNENSIVTCQPRAAESFLQENNIYWIEQTTVYFDDIITLMLTTNK